MCGIIGYTGPREAAPLLLEGLRKLEYRGYDSAGVAVLPKTGDPDAEDRSARIARCEGKIERLSERLESEPIVGSCGIGHTRWATHGGPSEENAHPHRVGKISLVHNGIIENHLDLKRELGASGRDFTSETDTEIFAHLIERALEDAASRGEPLDVQAAVRSILGEVRGTWALCVLHDDRPDQVVVARHGSPLLLGLGDGETFIASDVSAILNHTREIVDLENGDTAVIRPDGIQVLGPKGAPQERPVRKVDWSPVAAEKQGFKHFMLKEIHEQPNAISDTMMGRVSLERADVDLDGAELPTDVRKIMLLACGTSYHAALAGKYLIEQLARIPVEVDLASEFRYRHPIIGKDDLAIAISQSGETADTLAAMEEAKRLGARTFAVCNVVGSSIARAADQVLYTHAGPEISVASTKAFTTQLTTMVMLAAHLARRTGEQSEQKVRELLQGLTHVPEAINQALGQVSALRVVARRHAAARDFLYLGRGLGYPLALEGALKLKEISYVHAEGYAAGEMKHGPIALIDEDVPVVILALKGTGYEKVLSNLEEVRARGGRVIAVATAGDTRIGDMADDVIVVPDVQPMLEPIVASIPLQLLAYHIADLKGTDVDQPRNLAKSVTVE